MSIRSPHVIARAAILPVMLAASSMTAAAQQLVMRTVIATDVACRERPETSAPVLARFTVGERVHGREEAQSPDGIWYRESSRVRDPGCWIFGAMTADASNPEGALLAAADRILARTDVVPFLDYVAVDNFLRQTRTGPHGETSIIDRSPLVQFRRLQVLERAVKAPGTSGTRVRRDPMLSAWFFNYRDILRYHEPGGSWILPAEVSWRLYETHRTTQWAEEMAWFAAEGALGGDECDAACVFDDLSRTYARYWEAFPTGRWVGDALARAVERTGYATGAACMYATPEQTRTAVAKVRTTLARVAGAGRDSILAHASEVERRCRPSPGQVGQGGRPSPSGSASPHRARPPTM